MKRWSNQSRELGSATEDDTDDDGFCVVGTDYQKRHSKLMKTGELADRVTKKKQTTHKENCDRDENDINNNESGGLEIDYQLAELVNRVIKRKQTTHKESCNRDEDDTVVWGLIIRRYVNVKLQATD